MKYELIKKIKIKRIKNFFCKNKRAVIHKNAAIDEKTKLGFDVYLGNGDYRGAIIDDYSYIGSGLFHNCKIGKFVSIGQNVHVVSGSHPTNRVSSSPAFISNSTCLMKKKFFVIPFKEYLCTNDGFESEIGNDVWIGNNVLIKGGVSIGDGAVVGMGSVVTHDIPPYAIVAGNPAKIIRFRFSEKVIARLLEIKWWNFDEPTLNKYSALFEDVEKFIEVFSNSGEKN